MLQMVKDQMFQDQMVQIQISKINTIYILLIIYKNL